MTLDEKIFEMKEDIVKSVQQCVRIKSVENLNEDGTPFGIGVQEALEFCLKLSENFGFDVKNLDNKIGYAQYGNGKDMIAILGHLDVVPEGNGWTYNPYDAQIHNGKIYGRGTTDDKGPTVGAIYALKAIKDLNISLKKRVRIIFGLNEETGSECVKHYINIGEEIPVAGFTPDAEYPIINGEKGIVTCEYKKNIKQESGRVILKSINGGIASNVVPEYAKAEVVVDKDRRKKLKSIAQNINEIKIEEKEEFIIIKSYGISAHGSIPEKGKNAISHLLLFLENIDFDKDVQEFIQFMNKYIALNTTGEKLGIFLEDDISGKFVFNLGKIDGNEEEINVSINMRYPVTKNYEDFKDIFESKMNEGEFIEIFTRHKKSIYTSPKTDFIKKLQKVYEEKMGEEAELISIGGGTYAKSMPNIVAFGPIFKGDPMVEHKPDEYIDINGLIKNVQIMAAAICELCN